VGTHSRKPSQLHYLRQGKDVTCLEILEYKSNTYLTSRRLLIEVWNNTDTRWMRDRHTQGIVCISYIIEESTLYQLKMYNLFSLGHYHWHKLIEYISNWPILNLSSLTQLSILFQWQSKLVDRLIYPFHHFNIVFIHYWACSRPE